MTIATREHALRPTATPNESRGPAPTLRAFDGVICFGGEDWWYHNRGHYDMQMMRRFARRVPVLYINSIGMRTPSVGEGAMFFTRIARKLRSLRRGAVTVEPGFTVYSPFAAPGGLGATLNPMLLPRQIRRAASRAGITKPMVWVACPPGATVVDQLKPVGVVYQRTDRYERFKGVDPELIAGFDEYLKKRADVTIFCASLLFEEERDGCAAAFFADHGVDYDRFANAGQCATAVERTGETPVPLARNTGGTPVPLAASEPADVRDLPRPRVGFVGGIDSHTFDPGLFVEVARSLSNITFILVGACSLPDGWCDLPNVRMLGQKPYEEVPGYMAACDALIMPWNRSEWIEACNPVKLKEYLAVGRPIVTTPFHELKNYMLLTRIADTPESFAREIRAALADPGDPARRRLRVENETWDAKADSVLAELNNLGLTIEGEQKR